MYKLRLVVMGCVALGLGFGALGAVPSVTDVVLRQASQKRVDISYTLSDDAIVTLRVLTNGAPLSASALWGVGGDVNRRVAASRTGASPGPSPRCGRRTW